LAGGIFADLTAYARFLVAIGVMIATERNADGRLEMQSWVSSPRRACRCWQ